MKNYSLPPQGSPHGIAFAALTGFALIPMSAIAILGSVSLAAWSMVAVFVIAAAWPVSQRLNAACSVGSNAATVLRSHIATAADASLRAESLLAANGQRLQEVAEQVRISALNVRLHAAASASEECPLAAVAEGLETLAQRAEMAGRAAIRSSQSAEIAAPLSDEATCNLSRLTEELHNVSTLLNRDLRRRPPSNATA